ncbi:MAG: LicD family protein [Clostridiales bacterium]|nr:LicD family protein [Clostridiales bacterium]
MKKSRKYVFSPEELRELQLKELDTLIYFKDFCEKHNLMFCFCGGCCIGSLRNKGFVPWDDDIDVFMLRNDYEAFLKLWKQEENETRYKLLQTDDKMFTGNIFATLVDTGATCIKDYQAELDVPHGLVMDIFPLDGCPSGYKRKFQKMWAMIYSLYRAQTVPVNHGKMLAFGSKFLLAVVPSKKLRYKLWRFAEKKMSKYPLDKCDYITELCAGPGYMKNEYPKEDFMDVVLKDFEGYKMPLPIGYDDYLTIAFGDYMKMPPKEKQVPHHDVIFCDLKKGCDEYDRKIKNNCSQRRVPK